MVILGLNSLSVGCYLMALLGKFFPFCCNLLLLLFLTWQGCHGYIASKVHSIQHLLMCLFVMEFLSSCVVIHYIHMTGLNLALAMVIWALWYIMGDKCERMFHNPLKLSKWQIYSLFTTWLELLIQEIILFTKFYLLDFKTVWTYNRLTMSRC